MGAPTITRGACSALFVFEVGQSIDLEACERSMQAAAERQTLRRRGRTPHFFEYRPAPLRVSQEMAPLVVGDYHSSATVDLVLYDFGAISVCFMFPIAGPVDPLVELSAGLRGNKALLSAARQRVEALVSALGPTVVSRPRVADLTEDYLIFQLEELAGPADAAAFCEAHGPRLAQVLRADTVTLSAEEVKDALEARISFGIHDVTIVDWDAALVVDPDPADVRAVLEVANVQLLEMRFLDGQLDQALERSYDLLSRRRTGWRVILPPSLSGDLNRVATLQLESAVLLERVTNALKFFGEEYLTRIYRLVARRFHLAELDTSISRKLQTIESLYQKLGDRAATRRMEMLEWVVIVLIGLEIILSLRR